MTGSEDELGEQLFRTLESHERELKHALESLGHVQSAVGSAAEDGAELSMSELVEIGQQLERHEERLQLVVETLDEHKRVVRDAEGADTSELAEAMERARQQARQEGHPPDPTYDDPDGR